jgi:hypothetical protein
VKNKDFKTDQRLWLWIAFVLFAIAWFFPLIGMKGGAERPVVWLWQLISSLFQADFRANEFIGMSACLVFFICWSTIASLIAGWFIHCVIVILRTIKNERTC